MSHKRKIAIIGASYLQRPLVEKSKDMGLYTICFAWAEGAVCADVADKFYPISIVEKDEILDVCRKENIDGICTIASDVAAPTVAYIAEKLGLVGNSYVAACRANNKYEMRKVFMAAGVTCPRFKMVQFHEEIESIDLEYPLIVKPVDRSGSLGIAKVNCKEELDIAVEKALEFSFCKYAIVEEYIEGREISVEFISYKGKHYPLQITDKVTTGSPHFVELEHHQPADLSAEQYGQIYAVTQNALDALGVTNGASHSEYKITADGKIVVMEIGARMGGDFIGSDLVYLSTGYDFLKGVIDVALGEFEEPNLSKTACAGVYFLSEETKHLYEVIKDAKLPQIVRAEITDKELRKVTCSADRSGYIIYKGNINFCYKMKKEKTNG